jgi:hypothetical protein
MAKIEPKLPKNEFNKLVNEWVEFKKKSPSRIPRDLTYKLYNQLFNAKQRDVNACTCLDRDSDYKVTKELEKYLKLDPLPIESNVKIDMSSMTSGGDVLKVYDEEEKPKPKRKYTRKKKASTKTPIERDDSSQ